MGVGELNMSVHLLMLVFALMFMLKFARVSARIGSQSWQVILQHLC